MVALPATLAADLRVPASLLPAAARSELLDALSVRNPEYVSRLKRQRPTWGVDAWVSLVRDEGDQLVLPRGAGGLVRSVLRGHGIDLEVTDARVVGAPLAVQPPAVDLRPYQAEAVSRCPRAQQGLLVMGTGAGKTVTLVATIAAVGQPACILAHTRDLVDQWRATVARLLGVEAGLVAGDVADWRPITVATFQSLSRLPRVELEARARAFGTLVVDEVHHASAATYSEVISAFPARYRWGCTATPDRDDGLGALVEHLFGPRLLQVRTADLIEQGYLARPRIVELPTEFAFEYRSEADWEPLLRALVEDEPRNALIADAAADEARQGHPTLVLSGRVEHCRRLAEAIAARGVGVGLATAQTTSQKRRAALLDAFRAGTLPVLVASTLADEGLDVPVAERAILAFPGRSPSLTAQRLGRILRLAPGKAEPVLIDIVDDVGPLKAQAAKRRRAFAEVLGLEPPGRSMGQSRESAARAA